MSDLAKRIDVHANAGLLIQQWQQAPRMRALVDALQGVLDDHLVKPMGDMEERLRIDTAEGVWLDFIGERLMLPRPATMSTAYAFFGFHGSDGVGFGQGAILHGRRGAFAQGAGWRCILSAAAYDAGGGAACGQYGGAS